jgi:tetratricopeptide (TPR) repeat protein
MAAIPASRVTAATLHLFALQLLWLLALPALAAIPPWLEISGDGFVMVTDLPERKARALLRDFEIFQFGLSHLIVGETRPKIPTYLFALGARDFNAVTPNPAVAGVFNGGPFANYIFYDYAQYGRHGREIVFHEYIHFVLHNNPGFIYPAWYNEGLAELYSTLTERDGKFQYGRVVVDRAQTIATFGFIPTAQVLEIDYRTPDFRAHRLLPQFYAQAWLTTHYLMIGNQEHAKRVKRLLIELNGGATPEQATQAALGVSPTELHAEVLRYWKSGKVPYWQMQFSDPLPTADDASLRVLSGSEAPALLGYAILRASRRDPQRAERFFERALKKDPADPVACAGAAIVKEAEGKTTVATALLEKALARPDSVRGQLLAADLLFGRAEKTLDEKPDDSDGRATAVRARELYRSLLSNAVANNEAAYGYVRAAMLVDEPAARDLLPVVREATARFPTSANLAYLEARLSLEIDDVATASAAANRAVRYAASFEERKDMSLMLERVQKRGTDAAVPAPPP